MKNLKRFIIFVAVVMIMCGGCNSYHLDLADIRRPLNDTPVRLNVDRQPNGTKLHTYGFIGESKTLQGATHSNLVDTYWTLPTTNFGVNADWFQIKNAQGIVIFTGGLDFAQVKGVNLVGFAGGLGYQEITKFFAIRGDAEVKPQRGWQKVEYTSNSYDYSGSSGIAAQKWHIDYALTLTINSFYHPKRVNWFVSGGMSSQKLYAVTSAFSFKTTSLHVIPGFYFQLTPDCHFLIGARGSKITELSDDNGKNNHLDAFVQVDWKIKPGI